MRHLSPLCPTTCVIFLLVKYRVYNNKLKDRVYNNKSADNLSIASTTLRLLLKYRVYNTTSAVKVSLPQHYILLIVKESRLQHLVDLCRYFCNA